LLCLVTLHMFSTWKHFNKLMKNGFGKMLHRR
jgi:hypothetical protein